MKVYILTAHKYSDILREEHRVEHRVFSSKANAIKSYDALIRHLIWNYELDAANVNYLLRDTKEQVSHEATVDHKFNVKVTTYGVMKVAENYK